MNGSSKPMVNIKGLKLPQKRQLRLPPKGVVKLVADDGVKEWFYIGDDGKDYGPYSPHGLKGMITRDTLVWKTGLVGWKKAGDTELCSMLAMVKPVAPANTYNGIFELIASLSPFIVIVGVLLAMCGLDFDVGMVWELAWLVFVVCFALDNRCRKKAGLGESFSGMDWFLLIIIGPIMAPIWMISRARHITHKFLPPILFISGIVLAIFFSANPIMSTNAVENGVRELLNKSIVENDTLNKLVKVTGIDCQLLKREKNHYVGIANVWFLRKENSGGIPVRFKYKLDATIAEGKILLQSELEDSEQLRFLSFLMSVSKERTAEGLEPVNMSQ